MLQPAIWEREPTSATKKSFAVDSGLGPPQDWPFLAPLDLENPPHAPQNRYLSLALCNLNLYIGNHEFSVTVEIAIAGL